MSLSLADARALAESGVVSPRAASFLDAVNGKGQFIGEITLLTEIVLSAAAKKTGVKVTKLQYMNLGMTGAEYKNLKQNEGRITGPLPGNQEWVIYPWISRNEAGTQEYARIYVDFRMAKFHSTYFVDGVAVGDNKAGKAAIEQYLTPGAITKMYAPRDMAEPVATMGPKIQNVIAVNGITL